VAPLRRLEHQGAQLADIVERYVKKGEKLFVEGRVEYRQWTDKEGQTRYSTEINVRELILLGGRRDGDEGESGFQAPRRAAAPSAARAGGSGADRPAATGGTDDFADFPGALEGRGRRPAVLSAAGGASTPPDGPG
jgi:single-strand DNA-binding protein